MPITVCYNILFGCYFLINIIHDIYDMIFSVIYGLLSYLMSIFIKIHIFGSKIFIMHLATINTHEVSVPDQFHRIAADITLWLTWVLNLLGTKGAICIGNHMRPSTIKHESFQNFPKLPESRSDEGNLENFENSSAINPY